LSSTMVASDVSIDEGATETRFSKLLFLLIVFALPLLVPLMLQSARGLDRSHSVLPLHSQQGAVHNIAERSHARLIPFGIFVFQNISGGIKMMKDFSSAAKLGAEKVWGGEIDCGMCSVHVFQRWHDKHIAYWRDRRLTAAGSFYKMNVDFENYKNCSLLGLVKNKALLFDKMMAKWKELYGEPEVVENFSKVWRTSEFSRVEINQGAVVIGGLPSDNNGTEATNRAHKNFVQYKRSAARNYFKELGTFIEGKSMLDTDLGSYFNQAVHCKLFYMQVLDMLELEVSPLTVTFAGKEGRVIFASTFLLGHEDFVTANSAATVHSAKKFLNQKNGWLQTWKDISLEPEKHCSGMYFDTCIEWSKSFHTFTPITDVSYLSNLHRRLVNSVEHGRLPSSTIMDFNGIVALGNKGIMACSCGTFLHRAWCIHSCADAIKKKIIMKYPINMDPNTAAPVGRGRQPIKLTRRHT